MTSRRRRGGTGVVPSLTLVVQYAVAADGLPARATLRRWARAALECDAQVTLRFVGAAEGRRLNAAYRGRDYATNVLTFVYDDEGCASGLAGDIVLCVPVLRREARAQGIALRAHCVHLVIHGMLHLQGYDHERDPDATRMEAREALLLRSLGYADPYRSAQRTAL
jgi:probable rRNA maturation factor